MSKQDDFIQKWWDGFDVFKTKHPDLPERKEIPILNLIMKREEAENILHGKKNIEFRAYSKHYYERLNDKGVLAFIEAHKGDEEIESEIGNYVDALRTVRSIHFHNYSNTWYLDVECDVNNVMALIEEDVEFLRNEYDCHELDDELQSLEDAKEKYRPMLYYFVLGKVLDTNL